MKKWKLFLTGAGLHLALGVYAQHPQALKGDERLYKEGVELFQLEQYGPAQQALSKYLDTHRQGLRAIEAQYLYAVSGLYLFHPDAENLMLAFIRQYPEHPMAAMANFELGNFYFNKHDYEKAVDYLKRVPGNDLEFEKQKEAEFKLAYSYFALKKFSEAQAIFSRNKAGDHKYTYASNYYSGYIAYRNGDFKTAKADLRVAEKSEAYKPIVPSLLAEVLYKEGNLEELVTYGEQVLSRKPKPQNADDIQLLVGEAYYISGNYAKAAENLAGYVAANKQAAAPIKYKLAYAQYKAGKYSEAINQFKQLAIQKDSVGQNAAYHLGLAYLQSNNKPFALTAFGEAAKAKADANVTEQARFKLGQLHYEQGNSREVINALGTFRKDFPKSKLREEADDLLSEAYLNSSNYAEAIKHIESLDVRSERVKKTYQRVTYYQGLSNYNDGRMPDAVQMFDKSLQYPYEDSLVVASHFYKGEAYSVGQRWTDAANSYAAVFRSPGAERTPFYDRARYGIGYAYFNNKEYSKAIPHFKAYLSSPQATANPANALDATLRLGDAYYATKAYGNAIENYDLVISRNSPDADYAMFQKAVLLNISGKDADAKQLLQQMVQKYPQSRYRDEAVYQRAQIDFENGNYAPAISGFSTIIDEKTNARLLPSALQKRGLANLNLKKYNEASADFKRIIDEFPGSKPAASVIYNLQESLTAGGKSDEFDAYLARFKAANPGSTALESIEYETVKNLYFNEKYKQATVKLEEYLKNYPNTKYAVDARFFLADSYFRLNDKDKALQGYKTVINENKSEYVNRALNRVAELELENKNYPEAIKYYTYLKNNAATKKESSNAMVGLMKANFLSGNYDATRSIATEIINQGNASLNATNSAMLYRGKASFAQNKYDDAISELAIATNSATDENGAEAQYLIAEAQFRQKKYEESMKSAYKVNDNYASYEYWRGKAFLLLADNFAATNETFQARATLNSVIENSPNKDIVEEARQKLAALDSGVGAKSEDKDGEKKKKGKDRNAAPKDSIK